jgi:hypothetical protein
MNSRRFFQFGTPALLITFILLALVASVFYTMAVGTTKPTPTISKIPNQTPFTTPMPLPAPQYPDQAYITDGIIVFGIINVAIIIFGIALGRRMAKL